MRTLVSKVGGTAKLGGQESRTKGRAKDCSMNEAHPLPKKPTTGSPEGSTRAK